MDVNANPCPSDMIAGSQRRKEKAQRGRGQQTIQMHAEVSADDAEGS